MDRKKLSKLFADKQMELGMTQKQFAEWFSKLGGNEVSDGFIGSMIHPKKTSVPEWGNMQTIAKMWNVSLDELNLYLENDEVESILDASKLYSEVSKNQTLDKTMIEELAIKSLEPNDLIQLAISLINVGSEKIQEQIEWAKTVAELFKKINPDASI